MLYGIKMLPQPLTFTRDGVDSCGVFEHTVCEPSRNVALVAESTMNANKFMQVAPPCYNRTEFVPPRYIPLQLFLRI